MPQTARPTVQEPSAVFILGAPRCGSTFLFQLLSHQLRLRYTDKLLNRLSNRPRLALWLSSWFQLSHQGHGCFTSNYGATPGAQLFAPSECGKLFHRFFPKGENEERYPPEDTQLATYRDCVLWVVQRSKTPLLIKNLEANNWIATLAELFPDARFIHLQREPLYNAQSVLIGRRSRGIGANQDWSVLPKNWQSQAYSDEYSRVVHQIKGLDRQISDELQRYVAPEGVITLSYEHVVENPKAVVEQLAVFLGQVDVRGRAQLPAAPRSGNDIRLPAADIERLRECLQAWL